MTICSSALGLCPNVPLVDVGQTLDRSRSTLKYMTYSDSIHSLSKQVPPVCRTPLGNAHTKTATTQTARGGWPVQDPAGELLAWSALGHQGKWTLWQSLSVQLGAHSSRPSHCDSAASCSRHSSGIRPSFDTCPSSLPPPAPLGCGRSTTQEESPRH